MNWKKEFDESFPYACFTWNGDNATGVKCAQQNRNKLKKFIKSLLTRQREELRKAVAESVCGDKEHDYGVDHALQAFDRLPD